MKECSKIKCLHKLINKMKLLTPCMLSDSYNLGKNYGVLIFYFFFYQQNSFPFSFLIQFFFFFLYIILYTILRIIKGFPSYSENKRIEIYLNISRFLNDVIFNLTIFNLLDSKSLTIILILLFFDNNIKIVENVSKSFNQKRIEDTVHHNIILILISFLYSFNFYLLFYNLSQKFTAFLIESIINNNKIQIDNNNSASVKLLEEYKTLKSLEKTFNIKYSCFNKKRIVCMSPCSKKILEDYLQNPMYTWKNRDNFFVSEEESEKFITFTKLGGIGTYSRVNPELPEDIKKIIEYIPKEKDQEKSLSLIDTLLDIFIERKEDYINCTLLGVKKIDMPDGSQIVLQTFIRINEGNLEMFCVDVRDTLINEDIKAEIKYKTIFLSKVAHEFKNPLITINETIKQNLSLFNTKELNIISSLSEYIIILIKDFDYFSKTLCESKNELNGIETKFNIEDTDIIKIVEFCHNLFKLRISNLEKPLEFNVKIDPEVEKFNLVSTDELRLKQCIINLLSNSIKFTNFGSIDLFLKLKSRNNNLNFKTQNYVKIIVKDTGIGMEEKQLKKIEENTLYTKNQNISNSMGSGLGLIIVKDIIEKFGREFKIKSQYNKGTKVSFLIPLSTDYDKLSEITGKVEFNPENVFKNCNFPFKRIRDTNSSHDSSSSCSSIKNEKENLLLNTDNFYLNDNINKNCLECFDTTNTITHMDKNFNQKLLITNCHFSIGKNSEFEWENTFENFNNSPSDLPFSINKIFKIVIVDDEKIIRMSQINLFRKYCKNNNIKIQIKECKDGIECLYAIYQGINNGIKYDAIITDQCMNLLNGSYTAKIIKQLIDQRSIYPIKIFLSSSLGVCGSSDDTKEFDYFDKIYNKPLSLINVTNMFEELTK